MAQKGNFFLKQTALFCPIFLTRHKFQGALTYTRKWQKLESCRVLKGQVTEGEDLTVLSIFCEAFQIQLQLVFMHRSKLLQDVPNTIE